MHVLIWIVRVLVVLLLVWFAAKNADIVTLNGFGGVLKAPLALVLLAFFGAGLLLGLVSALWTIFGLKREIRQLNRALQNKSRAVGEADVAASPSTQVAPTSSTQGAPTSSKSGAIH
jgi:lipopolysaccharide assembly protein A